MADGRCRLWHGCEDCHQDYVCDDADYVWTSCPCGSGKIPADGGPKPIWHKPPSGT